MLDQTSIALAGTAVRRMQDATRYEDRVARPRLRAVRRASAAATSRRPLATEQFALQC